MLSIPIITENLKRDGVDVWVNNMLAVKADRAFVFLTADFCAPDEKLREQLELFTAFKNALKVHDVEVGIWINCFSAPRADKEHCDKYVKLRGVLVKSKSDFCPLDKRFVADYCEYVKKLAKVEPDLIMLDDDYRLSVRNYTIGCMCKLHRKRFAKEYGVRKTASGIKNKALMGKPGKAREAWLKVQREAMTGFAKSIRAALNEINPDIRLGCCMCLDSLDLEGTDSLELAKCMAGNTKPFFRTSGAPYWQQHSDVWGNARAVAEYTRAQVSWYEGDDVEIFSEGDVYPGPRYNTASAPLECFDAYLKANGGSGILKYVFDYNFPADYEEGYAKAHIGNYEAIRNIANLFSGKTQIGVRIFEVRDKIRGYDLSGTVPFYKKSFLPPPPTKGIASFFDKLIRKPVDAVYSHLQKDFILSTESFSRAQRLFAANGLPTTYYDSIYPIVCFGENARYLPDEKFANGLILDAVAADILQKRGVDVGLCSYVREYATAENFERGSDNLMSGVTFACGLFAKEGAEVVSTFSPSGNVASYFYRNADGNKFFVIGVNSNSMPLTRAECYFNNYYRVDSIAQTINKTGAHALPFRCPHSPEIALLAAEGDGELAVGLFNFTPDTLFDVKVECSFEPVVLSSVNCIASSNGSDVIVNKIAGYGFLCFTLSRPEN